MNFKSVCLIALYLLGSLTIWSKQRNFEKLKFPELRKFSIPKVEEAETGNKIKLRLIRTAKIPLIEMSVLLKGGDVYDPPGMVGLTSIMADLLRIGGTREMTPEQVDQYLDDRGIEISTNTTSDYIAVFLSCSRDTFPGALKILSHLLQRPRFANDRLDELKAQYATSISRRNDRPAPIATREFDKLIYGIDSPFAALLEYEHLDNISQVDIKRFHTQFFAPGNMLVGVTGPITMDELKAEFETCFGTWDAKFYLPPYPTVKPIHSDCKVAFVEKPDLNQSYIFLGHLGMKEDLAIKPKILVFNNIFADGFGSRLLNLIRTKLGLTYGAVGGIQTQKLYKGKTYFATFTKSGSTLKMVKAILNEINKIRQEKVTQKELEEAKAYFLNSFIFKYSSPDRILVYELIREFYGHPRGYTEKLLEEVKKVTAEDILEVAQRYLHPEKMVVLIVGKEKDLDGNIAELGRVKTLDISIPPPAVKIPDPTTESLKKGRERIRSLLKNRYKGYRNLKSLEMNSEAKFKVKKATIPMSIKVAVVYPDKFYYESVIMKTMRSETIINGNKGITKQGGEVHQLAESDIEGNKFGDLYFLFQEDTPYQMQYLWKKEIDGKTYEVVYIFDNRKNWIKIFINPKTGLIEMQEKLTKMPGSIGVAREYKSNFKDIKNIPCAFRTILKVKNKTTMEVNVKQISINPNVDPKMFNLE